MAKQQDSRFRLMTYNTGGARKDLGSNFASIVEVIKEISPDILVMQEATEYQDAEGNWHRDGTRIMGKVDFKHYFFRPVLSLTEHLDVRKQIFVDNIFKDWLEWQQGNAILSRWDFVRLSDPSKSGQPRHVPLYRVPLYQGSRDTEPRYALITRIDHSPTYPFVVGIHFSTLVGERGEQCIPGKSGEGELLRVEQARRLLNLLREHVLQPRKLVFLLGDLNATADESCVSAILEKEGGFMRLTPQNGEMPTHPNVSEPIDHIFVFPPERIERYECRIIDNRVTQKASDHLPVLAEVVIKNS